jgi:hypothetical protein
MILNKLKIETGAGMQRGSSLLTVFDLTVQIKSWTYLPVIPQSLVILNKLKMELGAGMQRGFMPLTVFEEPSSSRMQSRIGKVRWPSQVGEFAGTEIDEWSRPRPWRRWAYGNRGGRWRQVEAARRVAVAAAGVQGLPCGQRGPLTGAELRCVRRRVALMRIKESGGRDEDLDTGGEGTDGRSRRGEGRPSGRVWILKPQNHGWWGELTSCDAPMPLGLVGRWACLAG